MAFFNVLEHPLAYASISTGRVCVGSKYYRFGPFKARDLTTKAQGVRHIAAAPRSVSLNLRPAAKSHHGMIFFMPFFFLLVDSFLLFPLVPFWVAPWAVEPSVLAASAACPVAAWAASVFDAGSAVVVAPVVPFTESLVVVAAVFGPVDPAGAFGSGCAAVLGSAPSVAVATFSAPPLVVPPVLPGTIVATIPVPVPTRD